MMRQPPRVKICGITRATDALTAVEFGATAVGFVFWPGSPRFVQPETAREMARALPPEIVPVGVFVNQTAEEILRIIEVAGLHAVQLHGDEDVRFIERMTRPVIKAVALDRPDAAAVLEALPAGVVPLLDVHDPVRRGGTGRTVDWGRAAAIARTHRVILSGGLHAGNVREAVDTVAPWALDVSSGVEERPGVKDPERIRAFFAALGAMA